MRNYNIVSCFFTKKCNWKLQNKRASASYLNYDSYTDRRKKLNFKK
jgi:hypothetical protein